MALSTEEHDLLVSTCSNMNIAASTCHDVLEMLRNLGSTGVVDIAEHNNASTPHSNAANLVHIDNGKAVLGTKGLIESGKYPLEVSGSAVAGGFGLKRAAQSIGHGSSSYTSTNDTIALFANDSSGDLVSSGDMVSILGQSTLQVYSFAVSAKMSDGTAAATLKALTCRNGETNPLGMRFVLQTTNDSGVAGTAYTFQDDCFIPSQASASLGRSGNPFATAYLATAATVTSDRREKSNIASLDAKALTFIKALRPVHFTVKNGKQNVLEADENGYPINIETTPGIRRHWGLIAQEVQEALVSAGYDPSDCAVWSLADKDDPDSRQALRYEELIAPMIKVIQQQQERIEALERKVA